MNILYINFIIYINFILFYIISYIVLLLYHRNVSLYEYCSWNSMLSVQGTIETYNDVFRWSYTTSRCRTSGLVILRCFGLNYTLLLHRRVFFYILIYLLLLNILFLKISWTSGTGGYNLFQRGWYGKMATISVERRGRLTRSSSCGWKRVQRTTHTTNSDTHASGPKTFKATCISNFRRTIRLWSGLELGYLQR